MKLAHSTCAFAAIALCACGSAQSQGAMTLDAKLPVSFGQLSNVVELADGRVAFADTKNKLFLNADLKSGKVVEFIDSDIEALQRAIAQRLGYRLIDHRLELYGVPMEEAKG